MTGEHRETERGRERERERGGEGGREGEREEERREFLESKLLNGRRIINRVAVVQNCAMTLHLMKLR